MENLEIDDWKAYLKEKVNEEILQTIRSRTKINRPAGNSKFIGKMEELKGKSFNFNKKGRPKKEKSENK